MAIVTGDRYLESLVKFVEKQAGPLIEGTLVLKLNPVGLHYVQSRLESLAELERLLAGAPVDYLRAYVSDLGDHRALEQLRRILRLLTSLKVISVLQPPSRDPTPLSLLPFGRLKVLELRGCDLSTSAARGLLQLRHTLEKIICHNSTDALRHVFASRIAEIEDSPQWKRLYFVSCAYNGLVLMDESLRLLPVVETLDLSRNKFAKVDNLWRCTKLKHLDLGFNHLRTIASFGKVSCQIVKLVLRNNALTTLRGVENLKSLEGLDLSFNIISNFSELELLSGLPSMQSLWLEGNPLCSASWYRAQVYSFFPDPEKLKLDDKNICTREVWKRQIIIASRHKQPASFGFYSPAKDEAELEGSIYTKRKRLSRIASIESEVHSTTICSDHDSMSCDNESRSKQENADSDEGAVVVDFINRIESMKKERSVLWLEELKQWMNHISEDPVDSDTHSGVLIPGKETNLKKKGRQKRFGETSRNVSDSVQASGDENSTNILESYNSFADISINSGSQQYSVRIGEAASKFFMGHVDKDVPIIGRIGSNQVDSKSNYYKGVKPNKARNHHMDFAVPGVERMTAKNIVTPLDTIDDIIESRSSSACAGSPPHYQEDILHRRHNLEEEFLQLSAESYSVASSDSNTSDDDDDSVEVGSTIPNQSMNDDLSRSVDSHSFLHSSENSYFDKRHDMSQLTENGSCAERTSGIIELRDSELFQQSCSSFPATEHDDEIVCLVKEEADWLEKKLSKRKPRKRVISLIEEASIDIVTGSSHKLNGSLYVSRDDVHNTQVGHVFMDSYFQMLADEIPGRTSVTSSSTNEGGNILCGTKSSVLGTDEYILNHFNTNLADLGVQEMCRQFLRCNCILEENSECDESEVAIILSSEHKLYILLLIDRHDGSETSPRLVGCHQSEDVKEVLVGLGLQVVRLYIEREARYLFITRSIEKSRQLLCMLDFFNSYATEGEFSLVSLEQSHVASFERCVCGGSKANILQYSMVLFWSNNLEDDLWLSRSLFVLRGHMLVCTENILQFGSDVDDAVSPYFLLDSCCSIDNALEMVIESGTSCCVTLALECVMSEFSPSGVTEKLKNEALTKENSGSAPFTWKLKWFSEDSLFKFVAVLKAIHAATTTSPLIVRCIS